MHEANKLRTSFTYRQRVIFVIAGSVLAVFLGAVLAMLGTGTFSGSDSDDRLRLAYVGIDTSLEELPVSVDRAVSLGWTGSIRCVKGQGRYYRKLSGTQADPLMLLFDVEDRLIGINLHSAVEQPLPWGHLPKGMQAGIEGREMEYWDMNIFITKPFGVCQTESSVYSESW